MTLEDQLNQTLQQAVERLEAAYSAAETGPFAVAPSPNGQARWEIPKDLSFGDLANPIPFRLAARYRKPPQVLAEELSRHFLDCCRLSPMHDSVDRVEPRGGFINVFLSAQALAQMLKRILSEGKRYGTRKLASPNRINIEFVSANPTGPLSVAHGRQAAVGDVLARLLRSQGHSVTKEYYLNDEGRQMELLGHSLRARYAQALGQSVPVPEDGYQGNYLADLAGRCVENDGDRWASVSEKQALKHFTRHGLDVLLGLIRSDLEHFGLKFDRWTSQRWLRTSGKIKSALAALSQRGALFESENALWFASTRFGDDKDRVVRKRDGELTYLAPDIAYHQWKYNRGYDQIINLWGPDHHGYIARVKAAIDALGLPADRMTVRIIQLVTLSRRGKPVAMSKRQGEFVTFREIMEEVGIDATRFFFLMRTMESHLDFDLELAKSQSQENPVYYVQYAHARISSILAKSEEQGFSLARRPNLKLLEQPEELLLMRALFQYPIVLRLAAAALEPHSVTVYLRKLAENFHVFYTKHRVIGEDPTLSTARLTLIQATRQVLANGLELLGISAPFSMHRQEAAEPHSS